MDNLQMDNQFLSTESSEMDQIYEFLMDPDVIADGHNYNLSLVNYSYNPQLETLDYGLTLAFFIGDVLTHYYTPGLVLVGSIGNILSVLVFFKTKLRKLSSSFYLAALGISDTCFLIGAFISWLNYVNIKIYNQEYYCQFFTYFSGLCSFLSVWFVVAFTVERFIAVLYPLKRQTMCTVKRAKIVLCCLIVLGAIISTPYLVYSAPIFSEGMNDYVCDVREEFRNHMQMYNYIDTVVVFIIPFTVIVVLNILTGMTVWKVAGVRRTMTIQRRKSSNRENRKQLSVQQSLQSNDGPQSILKAKSTKRIANSSQIKVTKMLLIVSTVFVCLNLPSYAMRIKAFLISDNEATEATIITQYICWFFFITNFGINFALYCVSGQNFRKAVISMFSNRINQRQQDGGTQVTGKTDMNSNFFLTLA